MLAAAARITGQAKTGMARTAAMSMTPSSTVMPTHATAPARRADRYRRPNAAAASKPITVISAAPIQEEDGGRDWPGPGPAGDQCCRPASADHGSGGQQPARCVPGRAQPGEGGHDYLRLPELGHRSTCSGMRGQSLGQVVLLRFAEPVGQLLDQRRGQLGRQDGKVVRDQAGLGHGLPARAALIMAAKSCQSARLPDSARDPADVSRYSRLRRPATTDQDPEISPASSRRRSAG